MQTEWHLLQDQGFLLALHIFSILSDGIKGRGRRLTADWLLCSIKSTGQTGVTQCHIFFMEKLRTCAKSTDWNKLPGKAASEMTKANCVMWKHDQHECSSCPQAVPKELNKTWSQMVISSPRTSSCSAPYGQETLGFETWLTVWNCGVIFQEGSVCERQPLLKPTTRGCQKSKKSEQSCKSHSYLLPNGHQVPAGPASPSRPFTSQNTGHCPLKGSRQESCMSQHGGKRCRDTLQSWNQVTHLGERETLLYS